MRSGTASVTSPAPTRSAASAASAAAPVMPSEPASTRIRPHVPLCASRARGGSSFAAASCVMSDCRIPSPARRAWGMPISSTSSSPAAFAPCPRKCPTFGRPRASVRSARTAMEAIRPVSASTPLGISMASVGLPAALISSIRRSAVLRSSPLTPVPRMPSTTASAKRSETRRRSQSRSPARGRISMPIARSALCIALAAGLRRSSVPMKNIFTRAPILMRCRAAAKASPPLLPPPAKTANTLPAAPPINCAASSAERRPAFSIRAAAGSP